MTSTTTVITYGKRLEKLRRHLHVVSLQRERQRREPAEEVRADEAELGTPEREDDEGDRDPPGAADERVARRSSRA